MSLLDPITAATDGKMIGIIAITRVTDIILTAGISVDDGEKCQHKLGVNMRSLKGKPEVTDGSTGGHRWVNWMGH